MFRLRFILLLLVAALAIPAATANAGTRTNPFRGAKLSVDPNSAAARQMSAWRLTRPLDALALAKIAQTPSADWLGGWWNPVGEHVRSTIEHRLRPQNATAFFLLYNLPHRDCGSYSSGGLRTAAQYKRWIEEIRRAIGSYPAIVIVEPDALMEAGCLSRAGQRERFALEAYATRRLGSLSHTSVYLEAGSSVWPQASAMSRRLRASGIRYARGFALNTTSLQTTNSEVRYGRQIAGLTARKHFIINTALNGRGPLPRSQARTSEDFWCNTPGRGLGSRPTTRTAHPLVDAYEWFSNPGYSDGPCNGGPPSGEWWPARALSLARNAAF
jgi:endoglucanase